MLSLWLKFKQKKLLFSESMTNTAQYATQDNAQVCSVTVRLLCSGRMEGLCVGGGAGVCLDL